MMEDWVECTFNDVLQIISGKNQKNVESINGEYPIYGSGGKMGTAKEYLCEPGTTIIGRKGTINSPIYVTEKFWNVDTAFGLSPYSILNNKLLFYFCILFNFKQLDKSTTIPSLAKRDLLKIKFQLPPLPIQRVIVAKLESIFEKLDLGIADLQKSIVQLKIYRQSVYSSCLPKGRDIPIGELVNDLSQGWSPKCINKNSVDPHQWAVIKTSAIQSGKFVENENKILPQNLEPRVQHEIREGDVLITRAGPRVRVGICCLVKKVRPRLINCDKVYRLELNRTKVNPQFFEHTLNSPEVLSKIESIKSGSNDSGLNLTQKVFLKLRIPFIDYDNQIEINKEIDTRLSKCDKLKDSILVDLEKAEVLRQSILKLAFEGKLLTKSEIEHCTKELDYAPASSLLETIN